MRWNYCTAWRAVHALFQTVTIYCIMLLCHFKRLILYIINLWQSAGSNWTVTIYCVMQKEPLEAPYFGHYWFMAKCWQCMEHCITCSKRLISDRKDLLRNAHGGALGALFWTVSIYGKTLTVLSCMTRRIWWHNIGKSSYSDCQNNPIRSQKQLVAACPDT